MSNVWERWHWKSIPVIIKNLVQSSYKVFQIVYICSRRINGLNFLSRHVPRAWHSQEQEDLKNTCHWEYCFWASQSGVNRPFATNLHSKMQIQGTQTYWFRTSGVKPRNLNLAVLICITILEWLSQKGSHFPKGKEDLWANNANELSYRKLTKSFMTEQLREKRRRHCSM